MSVKKVAPPIFPKQLRDTVHALNNSYSWKIIEALASTETNEMTFEQIFRAVDLAFPQIVNDYLKVLVDAGIVTSVIEFNALPDGGNRIVYCISAYGNDVLRGLYSALMPQITPAEVKKKHKKRVVKPNYKGGRRKHG